MVSILDLSNNYLSGTINTTFNAENRLSIINLYGNKLKGKVPPSLINCRYLEFLDLGDNELNDTFPSLLGGLPGLKILSFRSNKLHGPISDSRTNNSFAQIRVIDLSSNGFSGNLPVSLFENFQAMKIIGEKSRTREYVADYYPSNYANTLIVTTKGLDLELPRVLTTEVIINLSRNRFEGYLPSIIGDLVGLRTLNLSHNCLEEQNDGLRGLPFSKDYGGDDGVPQPTTPVELDDEEEGDLISWQAVLMGFGCGLVIGLSIIYIMLSTHYPVWFSRMVVKFEHKIDTRMKRY
ncbi:receptor-like protein Cf-9 [Capsicum annuum]